MVKPQISPSSKELLQVYLLPPSPLQNPLIGFPILNEMGLQVSLSFKQLLSLSVVRMIFGSSTSALLTAPPAVLSNLPPELLENILEFVLSDEPLYAPTHLRLLAPRHVSRNLRIHAEAVMWRTLNASRRLLQVAQNSEIREWFKRGAQSPSAKFRNEVSFKLDINHPWDLELSKYFVGALLNCRKARVEIQVPVDLFGRPYSQSPVTTTTTIPRSKICEFSWTSSALGIRDSIPLNLKFPWPILVNDLPWLQLTRISLDCPLSDLDALEVLSKGQAAFESVSIKLTNTSLKLSNSLGQSVALPFLHSLTIDTRVPVQDLFSKLSLPALEHLELKCPITTEEQSPLLNEHLNIPWIQLKSLSLLNRDTWEGRCCPVAAILMKCSQLGRFQWDGDSDAFETSAVILSFEMSQNLEELVISSDPQGCQVLLEKLSYRCDAIRRANISHLHDLNTHPSTKASLRHWTHIMISQGVTLIDISDILAIGESLIKAVFRVIEGPTPTGTAISCPLLQELELSTSIRTPSLWELLEAKLMQSVTVILGGEVLNHKLVLDDMAVFLQQYPNLRSLLIIPPHTLPSSPYTLL